MKRRQGKSETDIRKAVLTELHSINVCGAIEDVEIEVNGDRPEGLSNWWIRRIRFRNGRAPQKGVVGPGGHVSRVEADVQSRFFAYPSGI